MPPSVIFVLVAAAGLFLLVTGLYHHRPRRIRTGALLALMSLPAWLMASDKFITRQRAILFIAPESSREALGKSLEALPSRTLVAVLKLKEPDGSPLSGPIKRPAWHQRRWIDSTDPFTDSQMLPATAGWIDRAALAGQQPFLFWALHLFPCPTIVIIYDPAAPVWTTMPPRSIIITDVASALRSQGSELFVLDAAPTTASGGHLEIELSSMKSLETEPILGGCKSFDLHIDATLHLVNCGERAADDRYKIRAWIDHSVDASLSNKQLDQLITSNALPQPVFHLANVIPLPAPLLQRGFHKLDAEIEFSNSVNGIQFSSVYHASTYFEICRESLVVVEGSSTDNATQRSWIHRRMPGGFVEPLGSVDLLANLVQPGRLFLSQNSQRVPYNVVSPFSESAVLSNSNSFTAALADARAVALLEPSWATIVALDEPLSRWVSQGGSVMVAPPPTPPAGARIPRWLPAVGAEAMPGEPPVDERPERRVYFLPDTGRAASWYLLPHPSTVNGAQLQTSVVNKLYQKLDVVDRLKHPVTAPLEVVQNYEISVNARSPAFSNLVNIGKINGHDILVINPIMMGVRYTSSSLSQYTYGEIFDVMPSWVENRLEALMAPTRTLLYGTVLKQSASFPGSSLPAADFDLPLQSDKNYRGSVAVVFALDAPQPATPLYPGPWDVWANLSDRQPWGSAKSTTRLSSLTNLSVRVIIVKIRIRPQFADLLSRSKATESLDQFAIRNHAEVLATALDLTSNDAAAKASADKVADDLFRRFGELFQQTVEMKTAEHGRAMDLRVSGTAPEPRAWRRMRPTSAVPPAAVIYLQNQQYPMLQWCGVGAGLAFSLAYCPTTYDVWSTDRGAFYSPDIVDAKASFAGWGLQRLTDPVNLASSDSVAHLAIQQIAILPDNSAAVVHCRLPAGASIANLPRLWATAAPAAGNLTVLSADPFARELSLVISPLDKPLDGMFDLRQSDAAPGQKIFLSLIPPEQSRAIKEGLIRVANLSGGAAITPLELGAGLHASFPRAWLGATLLAPMILVLLSPLCRRWAPFRPHFSKPLTSSETIDDAAIIEAALNESGIDMGSGCAQRPAGRVLQLRPMRAGDPGQAARRSDMASFVDEISRMLGSALLPRVYETPRLESISILTIMDFAPGSLVHDDGTEADRVSTFARLAGLHALIANKRAGSHRVAAFQLPDTEEDNVCNDAAGASFTTRHIATRCQAAGQKMVVPEIRPGEVVIVLTDPASDLDSLSNELVARCVDASAKLAVVHVTHPGQLVALGVVHPVHSAFFFDRNEIDPEDIQRFFQSRDELMAAVVTKIDGHFVSIRTDQSSASVVSVMNESIWAGV